ncbi:MAG: purine-nucleoside phosphorylase [Chthoniobacterales bacterium]
MQALSPESALNRLRDWNAEIALVLGSGLNLLVANAEVPNVVPYDTFPELPRLSVPGHIGQFVLGELGGRRTIFAQGRVHLYEGNSAAEVTAFVRLLSKVGIKLLLLTNAAGSLNATFPPGQWMMIRDHINLTGTTPLVGSPTFIDMTDTYSPRVREAVGRAASATGIVLHEGVYAGLLGPQYETPAEVRMLKVLGADAVGMSTVLEAIQARAIGLEVAGFSCLTNFAAGISATKLSHDEVLETGRTAAGSFARLLAAAIPTM